MKLILKKATASAATLFASALFVMTAPVAPADEYCITNGAQAAHGCGYSTMEQCRAASSSIGGICALALSAQSPSDALAYQPSQIHEASLTQKKEPAKR
jgi:Protein of unknown function (DUF3551)